MTRSTRFRHIAAVIAIGGLTVGAGAAVSAEDLAPRPGCGYGDEQHNHQAAPGLDPNGLRPGKGTGDQVHPHTAPPGQIPVGAGEPGNPRRGCPASPRG